jgi:hypothetical protein
VDEGYLADYDPATGLASHVRTYNFDNQPITSLITHFDGITGTATGYNLTGDYFNPGSGPDDTPIGAFFAEVKLLPNGDFGDATWTNIAFTDPSFQNIEFTSGNTVLDNSVLGIFSGVALPCGPCEVVVPVTLSYVANVAVPEPGALPMLAVGLGMLGLIRPRSARRNHRPRSTPANGSSRPKPDLHDLASGWSDRLEPAIRIGLTPLRRSPARSVCRTAPRRP